MNAQQGQSQIDSQQVKTTLTALLQKITTEVNGQYKDDVKPEDEPEVQNLFQTENISCEYERSLAQGCNIFGRIYDLDKLKQQLERYMDDNRVLLNKLSKSLVQLGQAQSFNNQFKEFVKVLIVTQISSKRSPQLFVQERYNQYGSIQFSENEKLTHKGIKDFFMLLIEIRELDETGEVGNKIKELKYKYEQEADPKNFFSEVRSLLVELNLLNQKELQAIKEKSPTRLQPKSCQQKSKIIIQPTKNQPNSQFISVTQVQSFRIRPGRKLNLEPNSSIYREVNVQGKMPDEVENFFYTRNLFNNHLSNQSEDFMVLCQGSSLTLANGVHGKVKIKTKVQQVFSGYLKHGLLCGEGEVSSRANKYKGNFSNNYKHGCGEWEDQGIKYTGIYLYNKKNGIFKPAGKGGEPKNFRNDNLVKDIQDEKKIWQNSRSNAHYTQVSLRKVSLSNYQLQSLLPGFWLSQSVIEAYLEIYEAELSAILSLPNQPKNQKKQYYLIKPNQFQDTFGSVIMAHTEFDKKELLKQMKMNENDKFDKEHWLIMALNLDQGHFLTLAVYKHSLFLFDSLYTPRKILIDKIKQAMLDTFKYQINTLIDVCVPQQQNSYDCGVYTTYFCQKLISLILRNQNQFDIQSLKQELEKQLDITQKKIDKFRYHIYNVLVNNYAILDQNDWNVINK